LLHQFLQNAVLKQESLESALAWILAEQLKKQHCFMRCFEVDNRRNTLCADDIIKRQIRMDLVAYFERDPACKRYYLPLLYFKGFHALQVHRVTILYGKKIEKI
jgi:serine O-acetyltransferase